MRGSGVDVSTIGEVLPAMPFAPAAKLSVGLIGWCRNRQCAAGQVRTGISLIALNQALYIGVGASTSSMSGTCV